MNLYDKNIISESNFSNLLNKTRLKYLSENSFNINPHEANKNAILK